VTLDPTMLLYTYISRFSVTPPLYQIRQSCRHQRCSPTVPHCGFNFSHKWPTFAFAGESGYTLAFANRIAHSGLHAETGNVSDGALSLPSTRATRSRTSPGRVSERRTLPLLGLGHGCSQRTQRAFGTAMRLCASLFRGAAAPLGCVISFRFCRNYGFHTLCSGLSACARHRRYHYPRRALRASETLDSRLSKRLSCYSFRPS